VESYEAPQAAESADGDAHRRANAHVGEVLEVYGRHGSKVSVGHVEGIGYFGGVAAAESSGRLISVVEEADFVELVKLAGLGGDVCRKERVRAVRLE